MDRTLHELFSLLDNRIKTSGVRYRDFAHHFAVQTYLCLFASVDEPAVSDIALATCRTEAYDPQATKIPFFAFASDPRINRRPDYRYFCRAVQPARWALVTFSRSQDSFLCLVPCCAFSHSWHISFPFIEM